MQNARCERVAPDSPWVWSASTGKILPPSCRAWRCDVCGPRRMARTARAFDGAGYDRWITVTNTPADWRQGMARLAHMCRGAVGSWEWAWVRERGPKNGMLHIHGVVRGPWLDWSDLVSMGKRAGFGWNSSIGAPKGQQAGYAAKAAEYCGKARGGWQETLELNGGRCWHQSRGYTRGVPMRKFVPLHAPTKDPGPWRLVNARDLPGFAADVEAWAARGEAWAAEHFEALEWASREVSRDAAGVRALREQLEIVEQLETRFEDRPLSTSDRVKQNRRACAADAEDALLSGRL